jgi:hypothetical protein
MAQCPHDICLGTEIHDGDHISSKVAIYLIISSWSQQHQRRQQHILVSLIMEMGPLAKVMISRLNRSIL